MLSRTFTVLALLAAANLARAQDRSIGFQMPSKNIACQVFADNGQDMLRCDIMTIDTPPRRPPDCELDYGHAFAMTARGDARGGSARICVGDTVMDPSLPVLGADRADVLQRHAARVFAGAGEAGGVLSVTAALRVHPESRA
jgi:hypothetical protein